MSAADEQLHLAPLTSCVNWVIRYSHEPSWHFDPAQLEGQIHLATPLTAVHSPPFQHPPSHVTAKHTHAHTHTVHEIFLPYHKRFKLIWV